MNPATTTLDGLPPGMTFADPTGFPKITVVAVDGTKATVKVEFENGGSGAPTCIDGTNFTGSGPGPESCAAAPSVPNGAPPMIPDGGATMPPRDGGMMTMKMDARVDSGGSNPDPPAGTGGSKGTGGSGTGGSGTGGSEGTGGKMVTADAAVPTNLGGAGGSGGEEPKAAAKSGCGCFVGGRERPAPLALVVLMMMFWRRRRR
jgi:MYXO-CTERM domain-containing protein